MARRLKAQLRALLFPDLCPVALPWFHFSQPQTAAQRVHKLAQELEAERLRHEWGAWGALPVLLSGLLWPLTAPSRAALKTASWGSDSLGPLRLSRLRQWIDQVRLAQTHNISPRDYYDSRVFEFPDEAEDVFSPREIGLILRHLNRNLNWDPVDHKVSFYEHCLEHRLPTVPLLAVFDKGDIRWFEPAKGLPRQSLFVKPTNEMAGRGAERWSWLGDGTWEQGPDERLDEQRLLDRLRSLSQAQPYLLQPCIENHPLVSALGGQTVCTARLTTSKSPRRSPEPLYAEFRMPSGSGCVDNVSAGGVSSIVDLAEGRLVSAFSGHYSDKPVEDNPLTGQRIVDFSLPSWREAVDLCCQAHQTYEGFAFIGWDVAFTPDGPLLIEANTLWGPPSPYLLGQTQFAECVLENLET